VKTSAVQQTKALAFSSYKVRHCNAVIAVHLVRS